MRTEPEKHEDGAGGMVEASLAGTEPLLSVKGLRLAASIDGKKRDITLSTDFDVFPGETLGIVGESGSGKSLTARVLVGLLPTGVHAEGQVCYRGKNVLEMSRRELTRIRGREIALLLQDPFTILNPLLRCGTQVVELIRDERGRRLRAERRRDEALRRLSEVGIVGGSVIEAFPFELSGGMRQRVGLAAAMSRDPALLVADEPTTALDVTTQRNILDRLRALQQSRGMGIVFITHDLRVAFVLCDRVLVLYAGTVVEVGDARALQSSPMHPYTLGLLMSDPPIERRVGHLTSIPGSVPVPGTVGESCVFAPRCRWATDVCRESRPLLSEVLPGRWSACVRLPEIAEEMRLARKATEPAPGKPGTVAHAPSDRDRPTSIATVSEITKVFGSGKGDGRTVVALEGVSLEVREGESVAVVGESGSGKTTLGRCMVGLEHPSSGSIVIDGVHVEKFSSLSTADKRKLRRTVQMIFQDPYSTLNPARTIGATLQEAIQRADGAGTKGVGGSVSELLRLVGLPEMYAQRKPISLSGGERQRVAIARALGPAPKFIVCDEPVSSLDVSVQAQILNLLIDVRRDLGLSYLFISHDLAVVRQIADRVVVLYQGRIVEEGPTEQLMEDPQEEYTKKLLRAIPRVGSSWPGPIDGVPSGVGLPFALPRGDRRQRRARPTVRDTDG